MRRWIALGVAGLGVAWGPYVYSELSRRPIAQHVTQVSPLTAADVGAPAARSAPSQPPRPVPMPLTAAPRPVPVPVMPVSLKPEPAPAAARPAAPAETPEDTEPRVQPSERADARDLTPAFRKAFDAEPRDAFWASDEEPRLAHLLQGFGLPEGAIAEVACRKSVCRVAFTKFELDSELETKLSAKIVDEFAHGAAFEPRNPDGEEHAPLYVLRAGYKLEP
jgi:hypothetical protein